MGLTSAVIMADVERLEMLKQQHPQLKLDNIQATEMKKVFIVPHGIVKWCI